MIKVNPQLLSELIRRLEAVTLRKEPRHRTDMIVLQLLYNIDHYLRSNAEYDASSEISRVKMHLGDCSEEVVELISPIFQDIK